MDNKRENSAPVNNGRYVESFVYISCELTICWRNYILFTMQVFYLNDLLTRLLCKRRIISLQYFFFDSRRYLDSFVDSICLSNSRCDLVYSI